MSTTFATPAAIRAPRPARRSAPVVRTARPPARSAGRNAGVRLTRRGRAVVLLLGVAVMLMLGVLWGATSAATDEAGALATETIRVGSGDTLWVIASERAEGGESVQGVIDEIRSLNELDGGSLQAGQLLVVPVAG